MKEAVKEWIQKAEEDFAAALKLIGAKGRFYNVVCFHCQQSVEKYIKAIMQFNEKHIKKTHSLAFLADQVKECLPRIELFSEDLKWLDVFAVQIRYPGEKAGKNDAVKAVNISKSIRGIVRPYLGLKQK